MLDVGKKIFSIFIAFMFTLSSQTLIAVQAQPRVPEDARIAFVRHHNLWLRDTNGERRISHLYILGTPQWSADGKFVAVVGREHDPERLRPTQTDYLCLEVVNADTAAKKLVAKHKYPATMLFKWAPKGHKLAVEYSGRMQVADFDQTGDAGPVVAKGVSEFSWMPSASGLILAADAHLLPDGWTNALLYKLRLPDKGQGGSVGAKSESGTAHPSPTVFFRLPKTFETSETRMAVTGVNDLKWSKDGHWLAFIAHPEGSAALDESRLCVLSSSGQNFRVVGSMLDRKAWYAWSPGADTLGFIRGTGRDTTRGKKLSLAAAPRFAVRNLAPMGAVDDAFCWMDPVHVIVSRHQEALPSKSPIQLDSSLFPVLFNIDVERPSIQNRITSPPEGLGDYEPHVIGWQQVLWRRSPGLQSQGEVWFGKADGTELRLWVENVAAEQFAVYQGHSK